MAVLLRYLFGTNQSFSLDSIVVYPSHVLMYNCHSQNCTCVHAHQWQMYNPVHKQYPQFWYAIMNRPIPVPNATTYPNDTPPPYPINMPHVNVPPQFSQWSYSLTNPTYRRSVPVPIASHTYRRPIPIRSPIVPCDSVPTHTRSHHWSRPM